MQVLPEIVTLQVICLLYTQINLYLLKRNLVQGLFMKGGEKKERAGRLPTLLTRGDG
jgi:hypothetical protein